MSFQFEVNHSSKEALYESLNTALGGILDSESDWLANLANAAALLFHTLPNLNWAGFYLFKQGELVLGPFQGKLACTRIRMGRGVCGTAAQKRNTLVVPNVHEFSGHIACDSESMSELVAPIVVDGTFYGVLDLDSPMLARFDEVDKIGIEEFVRILAQKLAKH